MKKNLKSFLLGCLVTVVLVSLIGTAFATSGTKTATLLYDNIKITLNGNTLTPKDANGKTVEPFIIDGTTYMPLRAVAEALGLTVEWDGANKTAVLSSPNAVTKGTVVYEDQYVTIAFDGIYESKYDWRDGVDVKFNITNKTDFELTFQPGAISFDGVSYQLSGSEDVAPNSTGTVAFSSSEEISKSSAISTGTISVIDFSRTLFLKQSYDAKWTGK